MQRTRADRKKRLLRRSFLESLETRSNLAVCEGFDDLIGDFQSEFKSLQNTVGDFWSESTLPLIGKQLSAVSGPFDDVHDAVVDAIQTLPEQLEALGEGLSQEAIDTALENFIAQRFATFGITAEVDASCANEGLSISLDLSRDISLLDESFAFDVGIGAVPVLGIGGEAAVQVGVGFEGLELSFGVTNGEFFYVAGSDPISMSVYADFAGTEFHASAGLFTGMVSIEAREPGPGEDDVLVDGTHALELALAIDLDAPQPVTVDAGAHFDLVFTAGVDDTLIAGLPYIECLVGVDWFGFDQGSTAAPIVEYRDVHIGFNGIVSTILAPIVEHLGPVVDRIDEVFELLRKPLPVLDELVDPDPSVLSLLKLAADAEGAPAEFRAAVELLSFTSIVSGIVASFDAEGGDLIIPIGDFVLSDLGDLREEALGKFSFESLASGIGLPGFDVLGANFSLDMDGIRGLVGDHFNAEIAASINELLDALQGPVSLSAPLLTNPAGSVFQLLLGQNVDLFRADVDFEGSGGFDPDVSLPGLSFNFGSEILWKIKAGVGLDTRGIRNFFRDMAEGDYSPGRHFGEGFYFTEDTMVELKAQLAAELSANLVLVHAGVEGGVEGVIDLVITPSEEWIASEANTDASDDKVYVRGDLGSCMGRLSGAIRGYLDAWIGIGAKIPFTDLFIGGKKEFHIAGGDLARFGNICIPNPFYVPPDEVFEPGTTKDSQMKGDVVPIGEHELWLNIGDRAKWREVGGVDTHDDVLVEHIGTMNGLDTLRVTYGGRSKIYAGINRIVADAGVGEDLVVIGEGVTADVHVQGGDGADTLISRSSGRTEMWGEGVLLNLVIGDLNDYLEGGLGENYLHGGLGSDLIVAGAGPSTLVGGLGADSLVGGAANDILYGDEVGDIDDPSGGNDVLFGGGGADELFGGGGDDTMFGDSPVAKPDDDAVNVMHGGAGADSIFAGDHGDTIFGGNGDDYIETGAGDDVIATYSQAFPVEFGARNYVHWRVGDGAATVRNSAYSINSLSLTGGEGNDQFSVVDGASLLAFPADSQIDVNAPGAKLVRATNLTDLNIDGEAGEDTINIAALKFNPMALNPLATISVNMATEFRSDGRVDHVNVSGSAGADSLVVESLEAWLQDPNTCGVGGGSSRDGHPDYSDCKSGGVMRISGMPQYDIYLTNSGDDLVIATGSGDDEVAVRGATGPTRIDTGAGNDDIVVSARTLGGPPPAWNAPPKLADFLGEVVVEAGAGVNSLRVTHEESLLAGDFAVTADSVSSNLLPAVHYSATGGSFDEVTVVGGNAHDLIRVQSTSSNAAVTRVTGWANPLCGIGGIADDIVVSSTGENDGHLAGIRNKLIIDSHADGETVVRVSDRLATAGNGDVLWNGNQLTGFAGQNDDAVIEFGAGMADVSLVGSNSSNVVERFTFAAPNHAVLVDAGEGANDQVRTGAASSQWDLFGENSGRLVAPGMLVKFFNVEWLTSGAGSDNFHVAEGGSLAGGIDAGAGSDTLDYSGAATGVVVDLASGRASRIGKITGIEHVNGGDGDDLIAGDSGTNHLVGNAGNDILVGRSGDDQLLGGDGRDILIGGLGVDQAFGGGGEDILIGGTTSHDDNGAALQSVRNEWSRLDLTAAQRRRNLLQGAGLAAGVALSSKTVRADSTVDQLFGQSGNDWFWREAVDVVDNALGDLFGG